MASSESGIWVRLVVDGDTLITGFVPGADSPNDFWVTFKSQLIRMERATEEPKSGAKLTHERVYINRDRIIVASIVNEPRR